MLDCRYELLHINWPVVLLCSCGENNQEVYFVRQRCCKVLDVCAVYMWEWAVNMCGFERVCECITLGMLQKMIFSVRFIRLFPQTWVYAQVDHEQQRSTNDQTDAWEVCATIIDNFSWTFYTFSILFFKILKIENVELNIKINDILYFEVSSKCTYPQNWNSIPFVWIWSHRIRMASHASHPLAEIH